uniref:Uncharacterized protein n=1 Tax=Panagrolaimus sp. JU765 TaxID=591449 RepID=A0AC34Q6K6_9BILA
VGVDPNHRYFDFNAQTANLWNSVVLTGSYNSIVVPEKAVVTSKSSFTTAPVQSVPDITAAQGVVYSMNYVVAGYSGYKTEKPTAVAVLKGRPSTTVVTCRVLEIVKGDVVQVVQGSNTISVTTLNQTMSFSDSSDITFYYKNTDVSKKGFLFEFHQAAAS